MRQIRPPGRGDFWILKIAHAPSPKNLSKNGFCPRKGAAFLRKAFLQKNFQVREKMLSAFAFGCSHALVVEGYLARRHLQAQGLALPLGDGGTGSSQEPGRAERQRVN